jgi:peptide/nickel transport system substrate-binding protein
VHGNAATRMSQYVPSDGTYAYGGWPDLDALYAQQARETDARKREALLHQIQRVAHDRVMFAPIWELAFLNGVGPRVDEAGLGLIEHHPYSSPYEDLKLKAR